MLWLQFKLWLIEKALRHHFGGHGEHFGHVVATATVPHRRARIATHALARFGIKRPAVEAYPERMLPWLHGMTNEGLLRMPLFFDGQPRMLLRLAVAAANGTIFQLQYGFAISVAIALGVLALMIGTEFWFGRARVWREWLEEMD